MHNETGELFEMRATKEVDELIYLSMYNQQDDKMHVTFDDLPFTHTFIGWIA